MSTKCISFLMNSFLYLSDAVENNYSTYQDKEIISELQKYREYVLENIEDIQREVKHTHDKLNINIDSVAVFNSVYNYLIVRRIAFV